MTPVPDLGVPVPTPVRPAVGTPTPPDHRGSWVPAQAMIATWLMELRKRRGLMTALVVVIIGTAYTG